MSPNIAETRDGTHPRLTVEIEHEQDIESADDPFDAKFRDPFRETKGGSWRQMVNNAVVGEGTALAEFDFTFSCGLDDVIKVSFLWAAQTCQFDEIEDHGS